MGVCMLTPGNDESEALVTVVSTEPERERTYTMKGIIDNLLKHAGYDEVQDGINDDHKMVIGYSTDMAFTKDRNLPYNRVVHLNDVVREYFIEDVNGELIAEGSFEHLTGKIDELIVTA